MKKILFLIAGSAMLIAGCKPTTSNDPKNTTTPPATPKACFSLNKTLLDSGETLVTTNCSTNAASYNWDFGLGISSYSSATTPTYTYFQSTTPLRGKPYIVKLTAYNSDGSVQKDTSASITIGFRRIDSIVLVKVPGHTLNDSLVYIQLINNKITTTSPQLHPTALPCTFRMDNITTPIIIDHAKNNNDGAWVGKVVAPDVTTGSLNVLTFGLNQASPVYFSRGLNASPFVIPGSNGGEIDVYYSLVPSDK